MLGDVFYMMVSGVLVKKVCYVELILVMVFDMLEVVKDIVNFVN